MHPQENVTSICGIALASLRLETSTSTSIPAATRATLPTSFCPHWAPSTLNVLPTLFGSVNVQDKNKTNATAPRPKRPKRKTPNHAPAIRQTNRATHIRTRSDLFASTTTSFLAYYISRDFSQHMSAGNCLEYEPT